MYLPSLRQLEYLIALKEHKSFSRAAESCHVTQSALSNGIKELEETLRQPVVTRSTRYVSLTAAGAELAHVAEKIMQQLQEVTYNIRRTAEPMAGTIRLGVIPTIAPYLLPQIIAHVQNVFPSLNLQIYEGLSDDLLDRMRSGDLEAALMAFPFEEARGLNQYIFFEEPFYLTAPKGKITAKRKITAEELELQTQQGLELLLLEDGHCLTDHALSGCNLPKQKAAQGFQASSLQTLIGMVAAGQGITLLPDMAVRGGKHSLPNSIDLIAFKTPAPARQIGIAWPKGLYQDKDLKTLTVTIEKSLEL